MTLLKHSDDRVTPMLESVPVIKTFQKRGDEKFRRKFSETLCEKLMKSTVNSSSVFYLRFKK